jgi:AcrR family transcriptional regulator
MLHLLSLFDAISRGVTRASPPSSSRRARRSSADATRVREGTAEKLVVAAASEFNEQGFLGTDTNKIARRAGFAPQTFYRWFEDKIDIFIKVYEHWEKQEAGIFRKLLAEDASDERLVKACVAHHRAYLVFRRSLRLVSLEDDRVRRARAATRRRQIERINHWQQMELDPGMVATALLQIERLSDALAEREFADMGLDAAACEATLAKIIRQLRDMKPSALPGGKRSGSR